MVTKELAIQIAQNTHKKAAADVRPGDTVRVHYKIVEGNKQRIQIFEGLVIGAKKSNTIQGSFTVRKVVDGVGVERTFPLHSPHVSKVERLKSGKVRQAKLTYVRKFALSPRRFRLKDKAIEGTIWQEVATEQQEIAQEESREEASLKAGQESPQVEQLEVAKPEESAENKADELPGQESGSDGRESSVEATPIEETPNSSDKSPN